MLMKLRRQKFVWAVMPFMLAPTTKLLVTPAQAQQAKPSMTYTSGMDISLCDAKTMTKHTIPLKISIPHSSLPTQKMNDAGIDNRMIVFNVVPRLHSSIATSFAHFAGKRIKALREKDSTVDVTAIIPELLEEFRDLLPTLPLIVRGRNMERIDVDPSLVTILKDGAITGPKPCTKRQRRQRQYEQRAQLA